MRGQLILFDFVILVDMEEFWNLWKTIVLSSVVVIHFHKFLGRSRNKSCNISSKSRECVSIVLVFFQDWNRQQAMLKLKKIVDSKCFCLFGFFSQSGLYYNCMKMQNVIAFPIVFVLDLQSLSAWRSAQTKWKRVSC